MELVRPRDGHSENHMYPTFNHVCELCVQRKGLNSREKLKPGPRLDLQISSMVVRGSNPGPGSNFSLEFKF